jgi:mannose-P-dolichol utilization defect protein 1
MAQVVDQLRPFVQSVTHNLPPPVRDLGVSLLGDKCYTQLLHEFEPLSSPACVQLAVSKGLSLGIVGASAVVKVPQLIKLVRSGSPAGVSVLSYILETASYLVSLAYNIRSGFPFTTYGETALIAVQNIIITVLVLRLAGQTAAAAVFVAGLAAAVTALLGESVVDMKWLSMFQAGAGMLGVASKLPQIITIWREGSTGQLSAFAVFNYLAGSLTRIFTTLQEVDDKIILYGFIAGFALNAVLAAQMLYYWNSSPAKSNKKKNKKGKKASEPSTPAKSEPATPSATTTSAKKNGPSTRRRG